MKPETFCSTYGACSEGREFALQYQTMSEVWENCQNPSWLFWILKKHKPLEKEQSIRLAIAFAETVIHLVPESEPRPKAAIDAAKAYLKNPTEENRIAAYAAADAADDYAAYAAYAAYTYAADAADAAAYAAARAAAYADARAKQCKIIREGIPNPFH